MSQCNYPNSFIQHLSPICKKYNCIFVLSPYNQWAFERLKNGAVPKPYHIKQRTKAEGDMRGYVVTHAEQPMRDMKGRLITSDLDVSFMMQEKNDGVLIDQNYGFIGKREKQIIEDFNARIRDELSLEKDINVISHGPFNQLPGQNFGFGEMPLCAVSQSEIIPLDSSDDAWKFIKNQKGYTTNLSSLEDAA